MKKLVFAALAAVAMVGVANAAKSYGIFANNYVKPYAKYDTEPGNAHKDWYSIYVMKQEDAQAAMGTQETVTYETMAAWLGKNFDVNKASVIENAEGITCSEYKEYKSYTQYNFYKGDYNSSDMLSAIGVFFYDDGKNLAYNVVANGNDYYFYFDDVSKPGSGWMAAAPEPTSAMLMLLGVAGLALKRKRG